MFRYNVNEKVDCNACNGFGSKSIKLNFDPASQWDSVFARYFLPAGNYRNGRTEGKIGQKRDRPRRADRFRARVEYFPAASEVKIKSGLIDEASVCQTFHLENTDKIRLECGRSFTPPPRILLWWYFVQNLISSGFSLAFPNHHIDCFSAFFSSRCKSILTLLEHDR